MPVPVPPQTITVIGVPMDLGQSRRGVDMGPSAVRYAGLNTSLRGLGHTVVDRGNLDIRERDTLPGRGGLDYLAEVAGVCTQIYDLARSAAQASAVPLFLGGDHSIALGSVGGVTHEHRRGLLWIDAHGDFNTADTSPSGNIHGMPLAALLGHGVHELVSIGRPGAKVRAEDVVMIGTRDLDAAERELLLRSGITIYTMHEIDAVGIADVVREALVRLGHVERLHVSLDLDVLDPRDAPGVGTPVPGGLSPREAHTAMELIAANGRLGSVDVVEVNPILDQENRTGRLARDLLSSLFGKRIL